MTKRILAAFCLLAAACTTDPGDARRTLYQSGFTDIVVGGTDWPFSACGEGDAIGRKFSAKNYQGITVRGVVCCGVVFKGCTVRF